MRTGGAQALAGLGVDPIRIQTMGRWKSDLVIRYSGARGACGITHDTVRGLHDTASSSSHSKPSTGMASSITSGLAGLQDELHKHNMDIRANTEMYKLSHECKTRYVENSTSGVLHKCTLTSSKTLCGLAPQNWPHQYHDVMPAACDFISMCSRCCRYDKNVARPVEDSSDDESC